MKRLVWFIVFATMFSMCAVAQRVVDVRRVENPGNGHFYVMTDTVRTEVSPLVFKVIEAAPTEYCSVEIGDTKSFFRRASLNEPEIRYIFEVAKEPSLIKRDGKEYTEITMTNGYVFSDPDIAWLAVRPGQHVSISRYIGLTRELIIYETVSRDTQLTDIDGATAGAPAKSRLPQMIEEVKAKAKASEL